MNRKEYRRWINGLAARVIEVGGKRGHSFISASLTDAQRDNRRVLHAVVDAVAEKIGRGPFVTRIQIQSAHQSTTA